MECEKISAGRFAKLNRMFDIDLPPINLYAMKPAYLFYKETNMSYAKETTHFLVENNTSGHMASIVFSEFSGEPREEWLPIGQLAATLWPNMTETSKKMLQRADETTKHLPVPSFISRIAEHIIKEEFCVIVGQAISDYREATDGYPDAVRDLRAVAELVKAFADIEERRGTVIDTKA